MNCYHAVQGKPEQFTPEKEKFKVADNLFRDVVINTLHSKYEDSYLRYMSGKELWNTLDAKFSEV